MKNLNKKQKEKIKDLKNSIELLKIESTETYEELRSVYELITKYEDVLNSISYFLDSMINKNELKTNYSIEKPCISCQVDTLLK